MNSILNIIKFLLPFLKEQKAIPPSGARGILFLLLFIAVIPLWGQGGTFPVQVIPQTIPPAPIYVSDYADASTLNGPLRVQIILNDFEISNREIRLKTYFTGSGLNFQSNDLVVGASPLFLEGGVPLVLTNAELAPYFEFNNITGISPNQYGNAIPEGAYQFCVEVYDVLTGSRLSNRSCAVSVVFQNEPPFLVLPRTETNVDEVNPQYIVFNWTPRSINVSNVEYELSLVEIWDNQVDPQQAFLSSPPVFITTTSATTYVYGPSDPQLLSGKNYAWRVQAIAKQGAEEIGLFKNQGFSEIFSFSYAGSCDLPLGVNHEVKGSTNANIVWDDFSTEIPEYTVRYRQKGNDNEWFESKTAGNLVTIWDLKPGTIYEYQLRKKCSVTESDWSFEKQFTTFLADDEDSVYDCNISPDFDISNQELLPNMGVGDKFTAGDFPITVLEVNGSNGRFNGKGYVTIPYLSSIKVAVQFTNIAVNTEKQLFEGEVITIYDPTLSNILDIDEAIDTVNDVVDSVGEFFEGDNDLDEIQVDWTIGSKDEITIEDGMVVITNPYNGVTKKEPLGDDMVITDQEGNTYYVSPEGEITEGGQITPGEEVNPGNVSGVSNNGDLQSLTAENIIVKFNSKGTYGFDKMPTSASADLKNEYKTIKDVNGNDYVLAHHAVKNGGTTQIQATIEIQNNAYTPDQVVFKNKQGKIFTPTAINGNTATISLDGVYSFENETIYAVVPSKEDANQQLTAGAFTLWHLAEKTIDVAIVSVGASVGDIATTVNGIFGNGLVKINFKNTISVDVNAARTAIGANGMDVGESPFTAAYNDEQKALKGLAKSAGANDSDTYYLLVLGSEFDNAKGIAGFMPLQRQFGFVFEKYASNGEEGKGSVANTVAHEIGHGIFALQHPFSQHGMDKKDTDWLMDYGVDELVLPHTHWSQMHDPAIRFYVFQDEEDGEYSNSEYFEKLLQQIRCAYASGIHTIEMPEKYQEGHNKQVVTFNYGLPINNSDINGEKITSGWFTATSGATTINNIQNAVIDPSKGDIIFGNFKIDVPIPVYNYNNSITPFEHLRKYLFPSSTDIEEDFNTIWENGIKQKIASNQSLSNDDVGKLKKIASCGTELLTSDVKYKLIKSLLSVGLWTDEAEEDLILDIIATTPSGNKSKELFDKINSDNALLEDLMGSLDDFSGNENNFVRLGKEIFSLFDRAYSGTARNTLYNNLDTDKKLYFYGLNSAEMCKWRISTSRKDSKFHFQETHAFNIEYGNYNPQIPGSSLPTCDTETKNYSFSYNDFIAVKFIGDQSTYDFEDGLNLMPASVYYILLKSNSNENIRTQLEAFMFVLGILTPIDEFYLLGKAIQYGDRGIKALRFSSIRSLSSVNKIKVPLNANGKRLEDLSKGKVDNYVEFVDEAVSIVSHIDVNDFNSLIKVTTVARAGGKRAVNNVQNLVNDGKALVINPIKNSNLEKKVDEYIDAFKNGNSNLQGQLGEDVSEILAKEIDDAVVLNVKVNESGHGFDVMQFENSLESPSLIRSFESKPLNGTSVVLPSTNKGTQMSMQWQRAKIDEMLQSTDVEVRNLGEILDDNEDLIEGFIMTIDKDLKQIIFIKIDEF